MVQLLMLKASDVMVQVLGIRLWDLGIRIMGAEPEAILNFADRPAVAHAGEHGGPQKQP